MRQPHCTVGVATGRLLCTFEGSPTGASSVVFSPDGRRIFSGSRDGTVRVLDVQTGALLATLMADVDGAWLSAACRSPLSTPPPTSSCIARSWCARKLAGDPDGKLKAATAALEAELAR